MKKIYFLAAAVAAFLAVSCAKEKEKQAPAPQAPVEEVDDDTTPMPVLFGSQLNNVVETKAAVDGWVATPARTLWILGFETGRGGAPIKAYPAANDQVSIFIPNIAAVAPTTGANSDRSPINVYNPAANTETEPYYYAEGLHYNFWGYYVDDAVNGTPAVVVNSTPGDEYNTVSSVTLDLTVDGTHDIMRAETNKDADLAARTDFEKPLANTERFYSSYTARRGVNPNLVFSHELSRFVFKIIKGGNVASEKIAIAGLTFETFTNGTLTIVGAPTETQVADWNGTAFVNNTEKVQDLYFVPTGDRSYIPLCDAAGNAIALANAQDITDQANIHPTGEYVQLGESVLAFPGQSLYRFKLALAQDGVTAGVPVQDLEIDLTKLKKDGNLVAATEQFAKPGRQYEVKLIVYGVEEVVVTVSLTDWVEAGEVVIDPDEDEEDTRAAVTLEPASAIADQELAVAGTYQIPAITVKNGENALDPQPAITYVSSNTNVATVSDEGLVTAVAAGEAEITVKAAGTAATKPGTLSFNVTVAAPAPLADNSLAVVDDAGEITLDANGEGVSDAAVITTAGEGALEIVSATKAQDDTDYKAFFSIDNNSKLAIQKNGENVLPAGDYTVVVKAAGDAEHNPSANLSIAVKVNAYVAP